MPRSIRPVFKIVPSAGSGGGILVMAALFGMFPFLKKRFAGGGYQGPGFNQALARVLLHLNAEIVKRSGPAKGAVVLPKRWTADGPASSSWGHFRLLSIRPASAIAWEAIAPPSNKFAGASGSFRSSAAAGAPRT
ncbi:MAG: hypothetical protein ACREDA_08130 [Methylocella sp.]